MGNLVSVIIPVYNVERYIAAAVQSVLDQTYENFELIIVDNGSPDRSIEICQQFQDPRIRIIRQENRGPSGSRNTGVRHAQGAYIAFLDGDDIWVPDKLAKHVAHLDADPTVGVSFCYSAFIDEADRPLGLLMTPKLTDITPEYVLCRNPIGNGSVGVFRRRVFEAIGFEDCRHGQPETHYFDEDMQSIEDVECWLRMAVLAPGRMEGIPEALTLYRVNSQGSSTQIERHIRHIDLLLDKARAYAPDLVAQWEGPFRGYMLRFLSRRVVTLGNGPLAVSLSRRAIKAHWRLLTEDPRRTLVTLAAACALCVLPQSAFEPLAAMGLAMAGSAQQRQAARSQDQQRRTLGT